MFILFYDRCVTGRYLGPRSREFIGDNGCVTNNPRIMTGVNFMHFPGGIGHFLPGVGNGHVPEAMKPRWCTSQVAVPTSGAMSVDHRQPGSNVKRVALPVSNSTTESFALGFSLITPS